MHPLTPRDVRLLAPGTPLNPVEYERLKRIMTASMGVGFDVGYDINPPVLVKDRSYPRFATRPKWTGRDAVNRIAAQIEDNIKLTANQFGRDVVNELVALKNTGALAMSQLGEYDIEKPATARAPVVVGEPLTVEYASGQRPALIESARKPVNWINVVMVGFPLLRLFTRR